MKRFTVVKREVHTVAVEVEAEDKGDAIQRVREGEGDEVPDSLEYSHTLDPENWTAEENAPLP